MTNRLRLDPLHAYGDWDDGFEAGYASGVQDSLPPRFTLLVVALVAAFVGALFAWSVATARAPASRSAAIVIPAAISVPAEPQEMASGNPSLSSRAPELALSAPVASPPGPPASDPAAVVGGQATWYCSATSPCTRGYRPSDLVAAIDPGLGIAKGTRIRVHHDGRSVEVVVVDVCACAGRRLVDLSSGAFVRLAPLSAGVIDVAIEEVGAPPTPPSTETQP